MPTALHPQAKFDPIPPDLDLQALVDRTPNFEWVLRVPAHQIRNLGPHEFEKLVLIHVINGGRPLVIEGWNNRLPRSIFSAEWFQENYNKKQENVWDIGTQTNIPMTTGHYLRSMRQLTDQWTPTNFRNERRQRLYLKDIDCPPEWHDHLQKVLPKNLFYLNDNVEDRGNARDDDMFVDERAAAPAGDLMSSLPDEMRAQNLMCYVGHEGTYTPAHREMCASLGQNIMVEASGDDNGEKEGSSIWFMTESKDREVVREYFLSMLGHDVEIEKHFAQINAWKKASFPVYIVEQRVGDFILVPPLAPHQVWNRGTRTMKVAWNRTSVETLDMALHEALPKARLVCRDEQYKNKALVYFTLQKYHKDLLRMEESAELAWLGIGQELVRDSVRMKQMAKDLKRLLELFTEILVDEMFSSKEKDMEYLEFDSNITCSYCRANIFNKFLTCKHCVRLLLNGDEDTYDVCMECYAMGRSCWCVSGLTWCEQWNWSELVDNYEAWRAMVIKNDGMIDLNTSPLPLEIARKKIGKKSVAQICQEQLRRRPFNDITKPAEKEDLEPSDHEVDAEGKVIKKKSRRKKKKGDLYRCHVCCHKDNTYRLAFCMTPGCNEAFCFGTLYRGFDMMPQFVLQQENWKCPKCLKICNCASCRRSGRTTPYVPKNTLLGHDTRRVADDRSVESLVDFRLHNLNWLKNLGEEGRSQHSKRMQRLRQQADAEKAKDGSLRQPHDNAAVVDDSVQHSTSSGYDESSNHNLETLAQESPVASGMAHDQENGQVNGRAEEADMSLSQEADQSSYPDPAGYPDPTMLGRERMLGLGYYQQDDSPDKILFDPYQQPSLEAIVAEEEPSEFLKKTMRAAKRKVRLETDNDPDFDAPRSHASKSQYRKKPRLDKNAGDQEANLDPALLGDDSVIQDAPADEDGVSSTNVQPDAPMENGDAGVPLDKFHYEANVPELRHGKPNISYAEVDNMEEFNDLVPVKEPKPISTAPAPAEQRNMDPLDLAADAIRSMGQVATPSLTPVPRKRGRPGRPRKSNSGPSGNSVREKVSTPLSEPPKKRERVSRTSMLASAGLDRPKAPDIEDQYDDDGDDDDMIAELEAQLDAELEAEEQAQQQTKEAPKKRRGRPPKNPVVSQPTRTRESESPPASQVPDMRFLSMAERMALKGKKIKISARTSSTSKQVDKPAPKTTSAAVASQANHQSDVAEPQSGRNSPSPVAADAESASRPEKHITSSPDEVRDRKSSSDSSVRDVEVPARQVSTPAKSTGPTVVRLGDSESEDNGGGYQSESASGSEFDDDDEDIPATKPTMSSRGGRPTALRSFRGGRAIRGGRL